MNSNDFEYRFSWPCTCKLGSIYLGSQSLEKMKFLVTLLETKPHAILHLLIIILTETTKNAMVIGHRPVGIISNTVMSDLIESHICVSVCLHVYAAYLDTQNYKYAT